MIIQNHHYQILVMYYRSKYIKKLLQEIDVKFTVDALKLQDHINKLTNTLTMSKGQYSDEKLLFNQLHLSAYHENGEGRLMVEVTDARGYGRNIIEAHVEQEGSLFTSGSRITQIKIYGNRGKPLNAKNLSGTDSKNDDDDMNDAVNAFNQDPATVDTSQLPDSFPYQNAVDPTTSFNLSTSENGFTQNEDGRIMFVFELENTTMTIKSGKYKWESQVMRELDAFERLSLDPDSKSFTIPKAYLGKAYKQLNRAANYAQEYMEGHSQSFLSGILVILRGSKAIFTATDDMDVYHNTMDIGIDVTADGEEEDFLVPGRFFANAFKHLMSIDDDMKLSFSDNRVGIEIGSFLLIHQNFDKSSYPPVRNAVPDWKSKKPYTEIMLDIEKFNQSLQSVTSVLPSNSVVVLNNTVNGPQLIVEYEASSGEAFVTSVQLLKFEKVIKFPLIALNRLLLAFQDENAKTIRLVQGFKEKGGKIQPLSNAIATSPDTELLTVIALAK